jgi:hypothetical protein
MYCPAYFFLFIAFRIYLGNQFEAHVSIPNMSKISTLVGNRSADHNEKDPNFLVAKVRK